MTPKILIMMATYNGEKYLVEQIDSIINQSYEEWVLAIQDDGSTDNTLSIINKYTEKDERIHLYHNENNYHGPFFNFHTLANKFKDDARVFDYYMFCDQDDIWNQNKVEIMVKEAMKIDSVPCLVFADLSICNDSGHVTDKSINTHNRMDDRNEYNVFFSHRVFGCNLLMNKELFYLVPIIDLNKPYVKTLSHDNLYTKFAATFGKMEYIPIATMKYRRHGNNATKHSYYKVSFLHLLRRVFEINKLARDHTIIYNQSLVAINMLRKFNLNMDQEKRLNEIEECIEQGGKTAFSFIKRHKIDWSRKSENISRKIILYTGIYKKYLIPKSQRG